MRKILWFALAAGAGLIVVVAQGPDLRIKLEGGVRPAIAIPDFRGSGAAQPLMSTFNDTLWGDIDGAGFFKMVPKTSYPATIPQQPSDFREPPAATALPRARKRDEAVIPPTGGGTFMTDWSGPPPSANYLTLGYTAVQNDVLVLYGWLIDLSRGTPANSQVLAKRYLGTVDAAGSRKIAHEFAADILAAFGQTSTFGTKIVFTSNRTGNKEIWLMDADGTNQRQVTSYRSISTEPTLSPDSSRIAFVSWSRGNPGIFIFSVDPIRQLVFLNQVASVNATPEFTPDGKQIIYASSAGGNCCRIFIANLDGSGFRPISSSSAIEVEPKINPKTGNEIAFVSGRSGPQQIYRMNMDGADVERLTPGEGEASNPSWNSDGQHLAFSWTQGYATGNFNIFVMDVATRSYDQLTHGEGRNENPSWAPDGRHIVFMSTRTGSPQIWSMLANGSQLKQLTTQGSNWSPHWGK